jgi:hypothetical protein
VGLDLCRFKLRRQENLLHFLGKVKLEKN